jgi:pimeloyl-ACP methyl ester carboxylesterase
MTMLELIDRGECTDAHPVPLLFVHGAWHAAWCWDEHFLGFFADKGFRAVAVSLRGHGASPLTQRLGTCSIADYVDDVRAAALELGREPVLIGHSLGCFVVQKYLERHRALGAVLLAPTTSRGVQRMMAHMFRLHPWIFLRASTFGNSVDLVGTPALCREFLFCAHTPPHVVTACAARLGPESVRAGLDPIIHPPKARDVKTRLLMLGAEDDGCRGDGDVAAAARAYRTNAQLFRDMGHDMMLERGWVDVAERIRGWLDGHGL